MKGVVDRRKREQDLVSSAPFFRCLSRTEREGTRGVRGRERRKDRVTAANERSHGFWLRDFVGLGLEGEKERVGFGKRVKEKKGGRSSRGFHGGWVLRVTRYFFLRVGKKSKPEEIFLRDLNYFFLNEKITKVENFVGRIISEIYHFSQK